MSIRSNVARIAGVLVLLCAASAPLGAMDPPKPSQTTAPKDAPAQQGAAPQATPPPTPKAPVPFRPGEDVSPGRKVSFPNDI